MAGIISGKDAVRAACATMLSVAALSLSADVLMISSQGEKGWIKDAQTLEDFRYAATNEFDYVTFEVGARKLPPGWFDESLQAIVGSGRKPWLVLRKGFVSGKSAPKDFETLAKAGFCDADIVVEANDVALLERYTAGHPDVKRVFSVNFRFRRADRRLLRAPASTGADLDWDPWLSILKDARAAKAWGVRLPSQQFRVRKRMIDDLHAAGMKVIMDSVNEPVTGGYYRRAGADAFVTAQPSFTHGPGEEWPTGEPKRTLLFGHRGGEDGQAPEHSPALTRLAVRHGMDIIKLDLQRTKDGEIVTSHDSSLKRVFGVNKVISQMTLPELKELVALPVAGYTNEHIQTLAEVLAIAKDGIPQFGLDFKAFTPAMAEQALAIIAQAGVAEDRVFIITYTLKALAYMKEHHPNIRRVMHTSAYYLPRKDRWQVYQDVPGHVGVVLEKGTEAPTYATRREACQRILDYYKREYGLYGINIGVFVGGACGPFGWFRVAAEDLAMLRAGGLWVSAYMPTDPVTCDYYRRAGADAFITASAAETYEEPDRVPMLSVAQCGSRDAKDLPADPEAVRSAYAAGAKWVAIRVTEDALTPRPGSGSAFGDVLACAPKDGFVQCEITSACAKEFPRLFDAAVKAAGLSGRNVLVASRDPDRLADFRSQLPAYRTTWLIADEAHDRGVDGVIARAKAAGIDIVCFGCGISRKLKLTSADSERIRGAGLGFRLFGVDSPEALAYAAELKVSAVATESWSASFEWAKKVPGLELMASFR